MKEIVVDGFIYSFSNGVVVASVTPISLPSLKCKAENKGICKDGFQLLLSGITVPSAGATIADPTPYTATFNSSAQKTKADGSFVLLVNDETSSISATPNIPNSPSPIPYPITFTVSITNANQSKVLGS